MPNKVNTKPYARKGYTNFFDLPTKKEYREQTHADRLLKWKQRNTKKGK